MPFAATRPDRALLSRLPFGEDWLALADPSDTGSCDPLDARQRMAMYRLLIERTNQRGAFGERDAMCPFWGYASQLAWQERSGRLSSAGGGAIDPDSWWGACNYSLSVIPYLAAADLGLVPALRLERDGRPAPPPPCYQRPRARWREALSAMAELRPGDDLEPIRFAVWRAHIDSIETAVKTSHRAYRIMAPSERRFARGWLRTVDLFGAAALRTDLPQIAEHAGGALPPRMLQSEEARDPFPDMSRAERRTVRIVFALADRPGWRWAIEMRIWRRMMRPREAREQSETILAGLLGRGREAWPVRVRALGYAAMPALMLRGR
jgi:hypothetical protein